ncbi:response regulator transcription factor [Marinicrinis sediminis]|uniref:Response regulator transcription factor n=1 Tax=Marinicrinis sediminis TaxID=1652465 RepID=A0ABW5RBL0_9BACL
MKRILIAEDDQAIARVLKAYLQRENYETLVVHDGLAAVEAFREFEPSLVLLDIMMPGMEGWEVLRHIRQHHACPVILLTSLSETEQKLLGFREGADDYITKPFVSEEVLARVKAVLARSAAMLQREDVRYYGSLKVDFQSHQLFVNGREVLLSPRDLSVFLLLAAHPKQVFSREKLLECVWGRDYEGSDRAVDLSIRRIRQALAHWSAVEGEIRTMHRIGYQLMLHE